MADCTISGLLAYRIPAGTLTGKPNEVLFAVPDLNTRRYNVSGTYQYLATNPNVTGNAALQFAVRATTDGTGAFSFVLPYSATASKPTTPAAQWSILYPDGRIITGAVPAVATATIDDLETTYSWVWASQVYTAPTTPGTLVRGKATFTAATSVVIAFSVPFVATPYITLAAKADTGTGNVPVAGYTSDSASGFTIVTDGVYTGEVTWTAVL